MPDIVHSQSQRKTSRMIQRSLTIVNCSVLIRILQRQECTIFPGFLNHKTGFRNQLLGYRNRHLTSRLCLRVDVVVSRRRTIRPGF
ncbi:hypothetical protein R6Q59_007436 [Mikania micrantha]